MFVYSDWEWLWWADGLIWWISFFDFQYSIHLIPRRTRSVSRHRSVTPSSVGFTGRHILVYFVAWGGGGGGCFSTWYVVITFRLTCSMTFQFFLSWQPMKVTTALARFRPSRSFYLENEVKEPSTSHLKIGILQLRYFNCHIFVSAPVSLLWIFLIQWIPFRKLVVLTLMLRNCKLISLLWPMESMLALVSYACNLENQCRLTIGIKKEMVCFLPALKCERPFQFSI